MPSDTTPPPDVADYLAGGGDLRSLIEGSLSASAKGADVLQDLLNLLPQEESATARKRLLTRIVYRDPPKDHLLAAIAREDPDHYRRCIRQLEAIPGMSTTIGKLDQHIALRLRREDDERQETALRVIDHDAPAPDFSDLFDHHLPALEIPPGWAVDQGGIWEVDDDGEYTRVTFRPAFITGSLEGLDSLDEYVCIEWPRRSGRWCRQFVPRVEVSDARRLVQLADQGLNVTSNNARKLTEFLHRQEGYSQSLPHAMAAVRLGWQGRNREYGFLLGDDLIGGAAARPDQSPALWEDNSVFLVAEGGQRQIADRFGCRGTLHEWRDAIDYIWGFPKVVLALYASLAAPCLGILPSAPNAILDWSGQTSTGKSSALKVAASVWGVPDEKGGLITTWDLSITSLERRAAFCQHLPVMIDDTKRAKDKDKLPEFIYQMFGGDGRTRGTPDGLRESASWRCVFLSTGEAPLSEFSEDAGARARVLSIRGKPFEGRGDFRQIGALLDDIKEAYGTAGRTVLEYLCEDEAVTVVRKIYEDSSTIWNEKTRGAGVGTRMAKVMALLDVGRFLAERVLGLHRPEDDPLEVAWEAAIESISESDTAKDALLAVWGWMVGNKALFDGGRDRGLPPPPQGWAGRWERSWVGVRGDVLRRVLRDMGFRDDRQVLREWRDRGWLEYVEGRMTKKVKVQDEAVWLYVIKLKAAPVS